MQDGARQGAAAGEWLIEHFAGDPAPLIDIGWSSGDEEDGTYEHLLRLLFSPQTDTPAA